MSEQPNTVNVQILGKEYQIACPPEEKEALLQSARFLDEKMSTIKASGGVIGLEKIAVMAALNITHELLQESSQSTVTLSYLKRMSEKIARSLNSQGQLL